MRTLILLITGHTFADDMYNIIIERQLRNLTDAGGF